MVTKIGTAGDDTLVGTDDNDTLQGLGGNDDLIGGKGDNVLDGGDGSDTADYSGAAQAVVVELFINEGFSGGFLDRFISIENVTGSAFDDTIFGSAGANVVHGGGGNDTLTGEDGNDSVFGDAGNDTIRGGAGADHLDGGSGIDLLDYETSPQGVFVNLAGNQVSGGDATGDTITGFENVLGSAESDKLGGDAGANRLVGGDGDDFIVGAGGNDSIAGGRGADQLFGGDGIDTLDYNGGTAVAVNLATGEVSGGDAQGDKINGFENVIGSVEGDSLRGDAGANSLSALGGNDVLFGGLGRDQLTGGTGADRFVFSSTTESGKTAATRDMIHDFSHADHDHIDLSQIDGSTSHGGKQNLTFIGSKAFTAEGQVRAFFEGDHTVVEVNTTGTHGAEMQIQLDHHVNLAKGDFMFAA